MSWIEHHTQSEELATLAQELMRSGQVEQAWGMYQQAARAEVLAIEALDPTKTRTLGVSVVSAAALWFKGQEFREAKRVAYRWLAMEVLPEFAVQQLEKILQEIFQRDRVGVA